MTTDRIIVGPAEPLSEQVIAFVDEHLDDFVLTDWQRQALRAVYDLPREEHIERAAHDAYLRELRRERWEARMYLRRLVDSAWARYGWLRPKTNPNTGGTHR